MMMSTKMRTSNEASNEDVETKMWEIDRSARRTSCLSHSMRNFNDGALIVLIFVALIRLCLAVYATQ